MSILVGCKAPDFRTQAVLGDGTIVDDFELSKATQGKYGILFFYPLDFTFVCPSEILAVASRFEKFNQLNCEVIGVSVDSHFTHDAWRKTAVNRGGIGLIPYTLASDLTREISISYGILSVKSESFYPSGVAMRATFIIDKGGVVRHQVVNDEPLGRDMDEIIRMVEALQFFEENGQVCPAGWRVGTPGMTTTAEGVAQYLSKNAESL